jgi:DNA-binding transcriptional MerR regulator
MASLSDEMRLRALADSGFVDGEPDDAFDRLTRVTRALLGVPVSLVSVVEPERQFFLSCLGLPEPWQTERATPISHSFCQHCVVSGAPFVVDDARLHPLVRDNPAIEDLGVVAYLGVPISSSDGAVLGTLCAIDSKARAWTQDDIELLTDLAAAAMTELERRALVRELRRDGFRPTEATEGDAEQGVNIAAVARRTGIPAATLRKWEQRYSVPTPMRTSGRHRRYSETEIARVNWLKARLADGYRIGVAAAALRAQASAPPPEELVDAVVAAAQAGETHHVADILEQALVARSVGAVVEDVVAPALTRLAAD